MKAGLAVACIFPLLAIVVFGIVWKGRNRSPRES